MSPHLSAVLRDFADDQGRAAAVRAPDADLEAREIVSRVRRRRLARASTIAASVVAVLALGAVTVYGVTRPEPVPPVDSPSPVVSPSSTPSPTQAPGPTQTRGTAEVDNGVTLHPLLPTALPLEPGMLAAADSGSSLVTFHATCGYPCSIPTSPRVTYLVTPEGEHFELRFDGLAEGHVIDWLPGSSRILVTRGWYEDGTAEFSVVDADTGAVVGGPFTQDADLLWLGPDDDVYSLRTTWGDGPSYQLQRRSLAGELLAEVSLEAYEGTSLELIWNATRTLALYTTSGRPSSVDDEAMVLRTPTLEAVPLMPFLVDPGADPSWAAVDPFSLGGSGACSCKGLGWFTSTQALLVCAEWDTRVPPDAPGYMSLDSMWRVSPDGTASRLGQWGGEPWPHSIEKLQVIGERVVGWKRSDGGASPFGEVTAGGKFVELDSGKVGGEVMGASRSGLIVLTSTTTGSWALELRNPFTGSSRALLAATGEAVFTYPSVITGAGPNHG